MSWRGSKILPTDGDWASGIPDKRDWASGIPDKRDWASAIPSFVGIWPPQGSAFPLPLAAGDWARPNGLHIPSLFARGPLHNSLKETIKNAMGEKGTLTKDTNVKNCLL